MHMTNLPGGTRSTGKGAAKLCWQPQPCSCTAEREGAHTYQKYIINQRALFPSKEKYKYKKNLPLAPVALDCHPRNTPHDKSHMGLRSRCFNSLISHQAIFQMADPSAYENQRHLQADLRSYYPKVKTQYNSILTDRTGICNC